MRLASLVVCTHAVHLLGGCQVATLHAVSRAVVVVIPAVDLNVRDTPGLLCYDAATVVTVPHGTGCIDQFWRGAQRRCAVLSHEHWFHYRPYEQSSRLVVRVIVGVRYLVILVGCVCGARIDNHVGLHWEVYVLEIELRNV